MATAELRTETVIECRGLTKWFGKFKALDDISFEIRRGEVVAIIGPSGGGKSTLVRCINGLELPSAGELSVLDMLVTNDRYRLEAIRQRVGMVFQEFNLFPQFTVEANVVVAQRVVHRRGRDEAVERAREVLDSVDMLPHAHKAPDQLSGGEQQRVAIARMLATEPEIILLDEPTASVDPELTKGIVDLMNEIARTGVTVVAVTHEMGFAREVADRVLFLEGGRLLEDGPAADVLLYPQNERTQAFLGVLGEVRPLSEDDGFRSPWAPPD